jgi:hypothetical protein
MRPSGNHGTTMNATHKKYTAPAVLLIALLISESAGAGPWNLTGSYQYMRDSDNTKSSSNNQSFSMDFKQNITRSSSLVEAVRYSRSSRDGSSTERISPLAEFGVQNDYFDWFISGTMEKIISSQGSANNSRSWETNLATAEIKTNWPLLQMSLGQVFNFNDQEVNSIDTTSTHKGLDLSWNLPKAKIVYSLDKQMSEDHVQSSVNKSTAHFGRIESSTRIWQDRLRITGSQQYSYRKQDYSVDAEAGEEVLVPLLNPITVRSTVDNNISGTDQIEWQNLGFTNPVINSTERVLLGIESQAGELIEKVHLFTEDNLGSYAANISWDIYASPDGQTWSPIAMGQYATYDTTLQSFSIDTGLVASSKYLLLIANDNNLLGGVTPVTIELNKTRAYLVHNALIKESVTRQSEYSNALTALSLDMELTKQIGFSYSGAFERGEYSPGQNNTRLVNSSQIKWVSDSSLYALNLGVSDSEEKNSEGSDKTTRSYHSNLTASLLPTLTTSLGAFRSESYEDSIHLSSSNSLNLHTTMTLFPDLDSSFNILYSNTINEQTKETSKGIGTRIDLTARVRTNVTIHNGLQYSTNSSSGVKTSSIDETFNMTWRPSDILSGQFSLNQHWADAQDTTGFNLNLALIPAMKMQCSLSYAYTLAERKNQSWTAFWAWNMTKNLSLQTHYDYVHSIEDSWRLSLQLNFRLAKF